MNMIKTANFPYSVFKENLDRLPVKQKLLINTINQYSFCLAEQDKEFKHVLLHSDVLLPDGIGIVKLLDWIEGEKVKKIAGEDVFFHLLNKANKSKAKCFFLGSTPKTLDKIEKRIRTDYPGIETGFYSPPFKKEFSDDDNQKITNEINKFQPDILFIGMTAPKQEKWAYNNKHAVDAKIIVSIGAVFDFFAETISRPDQFWIDLGLEWLIRLIKEPKRMWRRYLYYGPKFIGTLIKLKFSKMKLQHQVQ
ncbi:WecB/TagA/CpsF family glycosyltransferase [Pleomorphovibrio marinus]|uniref:WecB/TagA/CpsF family glycosyltransferase n=1 Tax=Pleomorphovibrio marinus TaxID=2164132 RepID=UPI0018E54E62|nr:WecB/TagA/CpsF family glycosyltransferase [Pleomorphovibrio marinus]